MPDNVLVRIKFYFRSSRANEVVEKLLRYHLSFRAADLSLTSIGTTRYPSRAKKNQSSRRAFFSSSVPAFCGLVIKLIRVRSVSASRTVSRLGEEDRDVATRRRPSAAGRKDAVRNAHCDLRGDAQKLHRGLRSFLDRVILVQLIILRTKYERTSSGNLIGLPFQDYLSRNCVTYLLV